DLRHRIKPRAGAARENDPLARHAAAFTAAARTARRGTADPFSPPSRILHVDPLPVFGVLNLREPFAVREIPVHRSLHARFERFRGRPSELAPDLRGVDRIATIMPRPILYERDEPFAIELRTVRADAPANRLHDIDV